MRKHYNRQHGRPTGSVLKLPQALNVEDDSEEGYIISTPTYYITVQLLEGEGIKRSETISGIEKTLLPTMKSQTRLL